MRRLLLVPVLLAALLVSGCNSVGGTNGNGYVEQSGTVTQIDPGHRKSPVSLSGTDLAGRPVDLSTYRGKPVVINVWGSWCPPCIAEGPTLAAVSAAVGVPFLGIDIRDDLDGAKSYNRQFGITYPSIFDEGSSTLLQFRDYPVSSPPTTFVLDAQGRVAAVVAGEIPSATTLTEIVQQVVAENG